MPLHVGTILVVNRLKELANTLRNKVEINSAADVLAGSLCVIKRLITPTYLPAVSSILVVNM
jgi:hypothetical protein